MNRETLKNKLVTEKQQYDARNQRVLSTSEKALCFLQTEVNELSEGEQAALMTNIGQQEDFSSVGGSDQEILFAKFWNALYEVIGEERADALRKKYNRSTRG